MFLKREDDNVAACARKGCIVRKRGKKDDQRRNGSGDVNVRHFVTVEEGMERAGFEIVSKAWLDAYDQVLVDARAVL